jgi:hypothetical protein
MSGQIAFLNKCLQFCDEAWKAPHKEVMEAYSRADGLAEMAAHVLFVLERLNCCSGRGPVTISQAEQLCKTYQDWYAMAGGVLAAKETSERADFRVEGAEKLRESHQTVGAQWQGICRLQQSIRDFREGRAIPMGGAFDGLRGSHQPSNPPSA